MWSTIAAIMRGDGSFDSPRLLNGYLRVLGADQIRIDGKPSHVPKTDYTTGKETRGTNLPNVISGKPQPDGDSIDFAGTSSLTGEAK